MLSIYKKISHYSDIKNTKRLPEDPSIMVLKTPADISLYRHAFNNVRGAVHEIPLFTPTELDEITRYAQSKITPESLEAYVIPYAAPGVYEQYLFSGGPADNMFFDTDDLPDAVTRASQKLYSLFHAATGQEASNIVLSINNITPSHFHEHGMDVMTYTAQGCATMGRNKDVYAMPTGSAVLMKPGYWHKPPGEQSYETPRLTFLAV